MTAAKRVALYLRVSTDGQTTDNQLLELQAVATRLGYSIVEIYKDEGISGAKGREHRPGLDAMLKAVVRKDFELVMAWSVDRLGRSLPDLVVFLTELHSRGVDLYLHQQGIDTTTPTGRLMYQMLSMFSEFERALIQERVKAGMQRAKQNGKHVGRPPLPEEKRQAILQARREGKGIKSMARELGVGVTTVKRVLRAAG